MRSHSHFGPARAARLAVMVSLGLIAAIVLGLLFGYLTMWLWNWLMPAIFGVKEISYWQAIGLVILGRMLVGGYSHSSSSGHGRSRRRRRHGRQGPGSGWRWPESEQVPRPRVHYWKRYDEWWKSEGRTAFEAYLSRQGSGEGQTGQTGQASQAGQAGQAERKDPDTTPPEPRG